MQCLVVPQNGNGLKDEPDHFARHVHERSIPHRQGREVEFDGIMEIIGQKDADRCDYRYSGPLAIFNFVDLRILPEKWEL